LLGITNDIAILTYEPGYFNGADMTWYTAVLLSVLQEVIFGSSVLYRIVYIFSVVVTYQCTVTIYGF